MLCSDTNENGWRFADEVNAGGIEEPNAGADAGGKDEENEGVDEGDEDEGGGEDDNGDDVEDDVGRDVVAGYVSGIDEDGEE